MAAIRGATRKITPNEVEGIQETNRSISPQRCSVVGHWSDPQLDQMDDLNNRLLLDSGYLSAGLSAVGQDRRKTLYARVLVLYCGLAHLTHENRCSRVT